MKHVFDIAQYDVVFCESAQTATSLLRTTRHHNIANFGYPTPQHREQTTRDDILIGTDLLGQLQSHVGERTSFSGVNPEKKTENGKPLEQQIAHCNR